MTWSLVGLSDISFISGLYIGTDLHGNKLLIANTTGLAPEIVQSSGSSKSWTRYIGVQNNTNQHLYFSIDHGKTWKTQAIGCNTVAVDPQTPTTLYCGKTNGGLFKSTDGGSSWTDILGANSGTFQAISVLDGPSPRLVVGSTQVTISTDQGASWNNYASGLPGQQVDLMLDSSNSSIFYLKYNDQYGDCHLLYRSIDVSRTWSLISTQSCGATYGPGVTNLYRDTSRILHSTDQGAHWDNLTMPDYCEWNSYSTHPDAIGALINAPGTLITDCRLFFGGSNGQRVYSFTFYDFRSDDGGKSWQDCGDPGAPSSSSNSRLIIDPKNPDHILLATIAGVRISTDGCQTWTKSSEGLGSLFVNTLARDPKNVNTIFAGTDGGAYVSFDDGQSWGQINDGLLGATVVYSIVVDPQSHVYAATPYGIFQLESK